MRPAAATTGSVRWGLLVAVAANLTALAALLVAFTVVGQVRRDRESLRATMALQSLWRLVDEWGSEDMLETRSDAAASLLADRPGQAVEDVLSFFDEIAFLLNRDLLDEELVWYELYWPMASYWLASQAHLQHAEQQDPAVWTQLRQVMPRLIEIEQRRRNRTPDTAVPTKAQIQAFLQAEVSGAECTDDDETETHRVPL